MSAESSWNSKWGSRSVDMFEKVEKVGEGTFGQVYMARCKQTGELVALKKVRMDKEREGFPRTAIREIKILRELNHPNIVKLKEVVTGKDHNTNSACKNSIYMVFEYMDHDLTGLMHTVGGSFSLPQIKCYIKQLLQGLFYCHRNDILHRDLKGSNLLINNQGILKLADFGLARCYDTDDTNQHLTNHVITLWYRPPELLLGATHYSPSVDMWSVGCILAELLYKKPILQGRTEMDQLDRVFRLCGTPDEEVWPEAVDLPNWKKMYPKKFYKRRLEEAFKDFPKDGLDLVSQLLVLDPKKRLTAHEALDHDFFWKEPLPAAPSSLPTYVSSHEFQTKRKRQKEKEGTGDGERERLESRQSSVRPSTSSRPQSSTVEFEFESVPRKRTSPSSKPSTAVEHQAKKHKPDNVQSGPLDSASTTATSTNGAPSTAPVHSVQYPSGPHIPTNQPVTSTALMPASSLSQHGLPVEYHAQHSAAAYYYANRSVITAPIPSNPASVPATASSTTTTAVASQVHPHYYDYSAMTAYANGQLQPYPYMPYYGVPHQYPPVNNRTLPIAQQGYPNNAALGTAPLPTAHTNSPSPVPTTLPTSAAVPNPATPPTTLQTTPLVKFSHFVPPGFAQMAATPAQSTSSPTAALSNTSRTTTTITDTTPAMSATPSKPAGAAAFPAAGPLKPPATVAPAAAYAPSYHPQFYTAPHALSFAHYPPPHAQLHNGGLTAGNPQFTNSTHNSVPVSQTNSAPDRSSAGSLEK